MGACRDAELNSGSCIIDLEILLFSVTAGGWLPARHGFVAGPFRGPCAPIWRLCIIARIRALCLGDEHRAVLITQRIKNLTIIFSYFVIFWGWDLRSRVNIWWIGPQRDWHS
jgi:hypothetical protein